MLTLWFPATTRNFRSAFAPNEDTATPGGPLGCETRASAFDPGGRLVPTAPPPRCVANSADSLAHTQRLPVQPYDPLDSVFIRHHIGRSEPTRDHLWRRPISPSRTTISP